MVTSDGVIQRLRVEKDVLDYNCAMPQLLFASDLAD